VPQCEIKFEHPIVQGRLVRRYKRFFMDVRRDDNDEVVVAHTANTGSMKGLLDEGNGVLLTYNPSPKRKLEYSVQALKVGRTWVGCNTHVPNQFVAQAIEAGVIPALDGYDTLKREVKYGEDGRSRIDVYLSDSNARLPACYVEVKNVTLKEDKAASFPDAVTTRGQKHLRDLMGVMREGFKAALVFFVQRTDCTHFAPADEIDPEYGALLREAVSKGLIVVPLEVKVTPKGLFFNKELPFDLG